MTEFERWERRSPLRYPGGKSGLSMYIGGVIEESLLSGCTLYEPYAGGASVSLDLLRLGFISNAVLVERDPLVYAFWRCVFDDTDRLCAAIEACPVTLDTWHRLNPVRDVDKAPSADYTLLQLGVAGLFFNRTNFSGVIASGPIGGQSQNSAYNIACRFNKTTILSQVRSAAKFASRIKVHFGDAITFLRRNSERISTGYSLVYMDPPYYGQGRKLYRHHYQDADHAKLAAFITAQAYPWVLSYDNHPRIRAFYSASHMQPIYLDYKVRSSRTAQELVISNLKIPPPVYRDPSPLPGAAVQTNSRSRSVTLGSAPPVAADGTSTPNVDDCNRCRSEIGG